MGSVQDDRSGSLERLSRAASGLGQTVEGGFTALTQALVQAQTQDADLALSSGLEKVIRREKGRQSVPLDEVKSVLGEEKYGGLAQEIRAIGERPVPVLDADGAPVLGEDGQPKMRSGEIPSFMIAGDLYTAHASKLLKDSAQHITVGDGWQTQFGRAAAAHVIAQGSALNQHYLEQSQGFFKDKFSKQAEEYANAGRFKEARLVVEGHPDIFGPEDQAKALGIIEGKRQAFPVLGALMLSQTSKDIPTVKAELEKQSAALSDDKLTGAIPLEHRLAMQGQVQAALRATEARSVGDQARAKVAEIEAAAPGDHAAQLALANDTIKDAPLYDATVQRLEARQNARKEVHAEGQKQALGRVFTRLISSGGRYGLDADIDFQALDSAGKAQAMDKKQAEWRQALADSRAGGAEATEARRQQAEVNRIALNDFAALPDLAARASAEVGAVDPKTGKAVSAMFPGVDRAGLSAILVARQRAREDLAVKSSVGFTELKAQVDADLGGLPAAEKKRIGESMEGWYFEWRRRPGNELKRPTGEEIKAELAKRAVILDVPWGLGNLLGSNRPAYKVENPENLQPLPPSEQLLDITKEEASRRLAGGKPAGAPAAAAPVVAPKRPTRTLPDGSTIEWHQAPGQSNPKVGEWKPAVAPAAAPKPAAPAPVAAPAPPPAPPPPEKPAPEVEMEAERLRKAHPGDFAAQVKARKKDLGLGAGNDAPTSDAVYLRLRSLADADEKKRKSDEYAAKKKAGTLTMAEKIAAALAGDGN